MMAIGWRFREITELGPDTSAAIRTTTDKAVWLA
jgi:hypothetical protein